MWYELELSFCLSAEMWQIILKFIYEHACAQYMKYVYAHAYYICTMYLWYVGPVSPHSICTTVYKWQINQNQNHESFEFSTRRVIPFVIKLIGV